MCTLSSVRANWPSCSPDAPSGALVVAERMGSLSSLFLFLLSEAVDERGLKPIAGRVAANAGRAFRALMAFRAIGLNILRWTAGVTGDEYVRLWSDGRKAG